MTPSSGLPVLGVRVDPVDYGEAVARIVAAAESGRPLATSALAVHGLMTGVLDATQRRRLNGLDLVVPDGQPVRWALRWLHGCRLPDRVYGPELMRRSAAALAERGLAVYLYGSTPPVLEALQERLAGSIPGLRIAGAEPSLFRRQTREERDALVARVRASGARCLYVGLGCPRQEIFAFENRARLAMPILAVGAAFDFLAGRLPQAPGVLQRAGLEWAFRLLSEPRRLWRRYLLLNPLFLAALLAERLGLARFEASGPDGSEPLELFG